MYTTSLFILFLCLFNINISKQENESNVVDDDDDEFIDIGVRLTGNNRDYLIADLIAEEKNLFNAGHVSMIKDNFFMFWSLLFFF